MNADTDPLGHDDDRDRLLSAQAVGGDRGALTELVRRHQRWVYHLALRLVLSPVEADDLAQEAMVRILTRLAQFEGRSAFRTWVYRIVVRCFLDGKRGKMEQSITTFTAFGRELDELGSTPLHLRAELAPDRALLVEEAKVGCMLGMLLCLDREQRVTYVLGEIFNAPSEIAASILEITPAAYRKRLERARSDMVAFMNEKCGLMDERNPCRCRKKTAAFMANGWVDPARLKFTSRRVAQVAATAEARSKALCDLVDARRAAALFREHPVLDGPDFGARLSTWLEDPTLRATFDLD